MNTVSPVFVFQLFNFILINSSDVVDKKWHCIHLSTVWEENVNGFVHLMFIKIDVDEEEKFVPSCFVFMFLFPVVRFTMISCNSFRYLTYFLSPLSLTYSTIEYEWYVFLACCDRKREGLLFSFYSLLYRPVIHLSILGE